MKLALFKGKIHRGSGLGVIALGLDREPEKPDQRNLTPHRC